MGRTEGAEFSNSRDGTARSHSVPRSQWPMNPPDVDPHWIDLMARRLGESVGSTFQFGDSISKLRDSIPELRDPIPQLRDPISQLRDSISQLGDLTSELGDSTPVPLKGEFLFACEDF